MPLWAHAVNGLRGRRPCASARRTIPFAPIITTVDPAFFETAGIAIHAGRGFTDLDRDASTPVAIVNEAMARELWLSVAVGRRVQLPGETQSSPNRRRRPHLQLHSVGRAAAVLRLRAA